MAMISTEMLRKMPIKIIKFIWFCIWHKSVARRKSNNKKFATAFNTEWFWLINTIMAYSSEVWTQKVLVGIGDL